jgi:Bacterial membrane protein YfhO
MQEPAKSNPRTGLIPWTLALLGPLILLGPMLAQGRVLFWGTPLLQFYPWHSFALETIRNGYVPLWNPLLGMGAPLLANHQSALLYPPNWLLLLIEPAWGRGFLLLLHLLWTAAGMVVLARKLGAGSLGQVVAAQAWSLSTFLVSRGGFFSLTAAAAWIPWVLLLSVRLAERVSEGWRGRLTIRSVVLLGVAISLQALAGHAQITWYGLILGVGLSLLWVRGTTGLLRVVGGWAAALALAFALSAAQLLPTIEYLLQSSRAGGLDAEAALTYSFWPWRTLGILLPGLFGSPVVGDFWGYGNYWEDALYLGVLPLLMAATAVLGLRKLEGTRRTALFLAGAAGLAFLLGLGSNTPLYAWLYRNVPTFAMFNAPSRWNVVTALCLALIAGIGVGLWTPPSPRGRYWKRLALAGAVAMVAVSVAVRQAGLDLQPSLPRSFVGLGILLAAAALLQLRWPTQVSPGWWALVAAVVGADMLAANAGILPTTSVDLYRTSTDLKRSVGDGHRLYMPAALEYEVKFERTHRFDTFNPGLVWLDVREAGLPNTSMIEALPSANNFDPLLSASYVEWMNMVEATGLQPALLRLADIGWLGRSDLDSPPWVTYRAIEGAARVRVIPEAQWVETRSQALDLLRAGTIDVDSVVLLEVGHDRTAASGGPGQAEIAAVNDPNVVHVRARAADGGWLLLSDAFYPGWRATVDGEPTTLYRADGLFRALWVPPGDHEIIFVYRPWTFAFGMVLSAVTWSLVLAFGLRWRFD